MKLNPLLLGTAETLSFWRGEQAYSAGVAGCWCLRHWSSISILRITNKSSSQFTQVWHVYIWTGSEELIMGLKVFTFCVRIYRLFFHICNRLNRRSSYTARSHLGALLINTFDSRTLKAVWYSTIWGAVIFYSCRNNLQPYIYIYIIYK